VDCGDGTARLWGVNTAGAYATAAIRANVGGLMRYTAATPPSIQGGTVDTIVRSTNRTYAQLPYVNPIAAAPADTTHIAGIMTP